MNAKKGAAPKVDFSKLALSSLRKYKKTHRVRMKPTTNKHELAEVLSKHFSQLPPPEDESQVIESFAAAIKNHVWQLTDRVKYPEVLPARRVLGNDAIKYSVSLEGDCQLVQSNFVLTRTDAEHFGYFPLLCGRDASDLCRVTFTAEDALLDAANYEIKLIIVSQKADATTRVFEWNMGIVDFTGANVASGDKKGTADQLEDIFEKREPENRPPFSNVIKPDTGLLISAVFTAITLFPLVYLFTAWNRLGVLGSPAKKILSLTISQKLFYLLFLSWLGLVVANWIFLDTFRTIKVGSVLVMPTLIFGLRGLREAVALSVNKDKKQN
ncbi:Oligosaccharyltransferase delta subunit [Paramicrosporidium saccamoebae]|uniref:Oligosaccharyltransferase delta subunit n=1 Tax=Paramicrosporidium saccamoebae TaxID=1246581 RepID=A0A2H9TH44_9FUNG|nr:Oligosaccharyltransferase delta subunit [Paramicrosporidium saccamoebae]